MQALRNTYLAALLCGALAPTIAFAQATFPTRPITMAENQRIAGRIHSYIKTEVEKVTKLVRTSGIKVD